MPFRITKLDPKENLHATALMRDRPASMVLWSAHQDGIARTDFTQYPCAENELRRIAMGKPVLQELRLILLGESGHLTGYLGHPAEYKIRARNNEPGLRGKLVSPSNTLLRQLQPLLRPGALERIASHLQETKQRVANAKSRLDAVEDRIAELAHYLLPLVPQQTNRRGPLPSNNQDE